MVARKRQNRVTDLKTGISTIDYAGETVGSITVVGLIEGWADKDPWLDDVWIIRCSKYNCEKIVSLRRLRPLLSSRQALDGRNWESRYDYMRGAQVEGTSLTVIDHALRPKNRAGRTDAVERHFFCKCSLSGTSRWVASCDLLSGNTKSFKVKSRMRPQGLKIDQDLDDFIGDNNVYEGVTTIATDGRSSTYYRMTIDGLPQLLHRVAWYVRFGVWPSSSQVVHHVNHNTADNRICNLELLDQRGVRNNSQSLHKMRKQNGKSVTSAYKGVHWDKTRGLWTASITFRNVHQHIGRYDSELAARDAYDKKAQQLNDDYGCIFTLNAELPIIPVSHKHPPVFCRMR